MDTKNYEYPATKQIFAKKTENLFQKITIPVKLYSHKIMRSQKTISNHRSQNYKNDHKITRETRGDNHKIIKTITK